MKNSRWRASSPLPQTLTFRAPVPADIPVLLPLPPGEVFDGFNTFRCGQIFRWREHDGAWYGPWGATSLCVRLTPSGLEVRAQGAQVTVGEVRDFLGLDVPLQELRRPFAADRWVSAALEVLPGLRILRQDPWECLFNFICSQNSNIPKIELSTERVARGWGAVHQWGEGIEVAVLPAPEQVAALDPAALRSCGLGYRAPYLVRSACRIAGSDPDLHTLRELPYTQVLEALLELPGIGRKVADCIMLFALDKPFACPVDVWVRRVIHELYPRGLRRYLPNAKALAEKALTAREYDAIQRFAWDRWGMLAGYAQQYLFHARRLDLVGPTVI